MPTTLASYLRGARLRHGWSQPYTAGRAGISLSTLLSVEAGRPAWPETVRRLACALGVDAERAQDLLVQLARAERAAHHDPTRGSAGGPSGQGRP